MACRNSPRLNNQRIIAAAAAPTASGVSATGAVDENAVLDTVIVGAGVSGLTTAMVRHLIFLLLTLFPQTK